MEFRDYLRMFRRGWPILLLVTALGIAAAASYLQVVPKRYDATAEVLVSTQGATSISDMQVGSQFTQRAARTYAELATSPVVIDPVITDLGLTETREEVAGQLVVAPVGDTALLQITASGNDAAQTAALANSVASTLTTVVRDLETNRTVVGSRNFVRVTPVQTALVPSIAVSPNVKRIMASGLVVGFLLGLALTIVMTTLDTRIRRSRDLWSLTDTPLLAAIPKVRRAKLHPLVARDDPSGAVGEAFRTLRTNLRFLETSGPRSLVVASTVEEKNGVDVAANLAFALAEAGYSVVLVDVDLRHPRVGLIMEVEHGRGLSDVLAQQVDLTESLVPTSHPKLTALLAGTVPPNPSELLGSPQMRDVLDSLEKRFDYVVLDAPAVLSYTDAAVISVAADRTVVTVGAGKTRSNELSAALRALSNVGTKPVGVVLTRVSTARMDPEEYIRPPDRRLRLPSASTNGARKPAPVRGGRQ
jgi:succinoglycan biosynthesis transport protein ExoP